jgi:uncharacterized protein
MILVDSGVWLALASSEDRDHEAALHALRRVREPLATTWPVLSETCRLLTSRHGPRAAFLLVQSGTLGAFQVVDFREPHLARILELMKQYETPPMDLTDASLVVAAEVLGSGRILSTDRRDVRGYEWKEWKVFRNLMAL